MPERDHLVKDTAQRPDITLLIVRLFLANLRREVVGSADSCLRAIIGVLKNTGDSEVTNLDLPTLRHENVLCLQVTMQNLSVMNVLDGQSHLDEPVENLILAVADCKSRKRSGKMDNTFSQTTMLTIRHSSHSDVIGYRATINRLTSSDFLLVGNLGVQVTTICIVHDDAKAALIHEGLFIRDDVRVPHGFEDMHLEWHKSNQTLAIGHAQCTYLIDGVFSLLSIHLGHVNNLHRKVLVSFIVVALYLHHICVSVGH